MEERDTNVENVRKVSKMLLHAVEIHCDNPFGIVQHPFTSFTQLMLNNQELVDITTEQGYTKWIQQMEDFFSKASVEQIFCVSLNSAWKLTWLKYVKQDLSQHDFSKILACAWMEEENPNMDANVSIRESIQWFKEADKKIMMTEDEYEYWYNLPDKVTLYRGVSVGRKKYGLSWTDDEETAKWFQRRFETEKEKGVLLKVEAPKKHCLCYLNRQEEKEIVLNVNAVKKLIEEI